MTIPKILVVDHDPAILKRIRELLIFEKVEISTTTSAFEALDLLTREQFQVILADQEMPYLTGPELLLKARELAPEAAPILMAEAAGLEAARSTEGSVPEDTRFIRKPLHDDEFLLVYRQALARSEYWTRQGEVDGMRSDLEEISHNLTENNIHWIHEIYQLKLEVKNSQMDTLRILATLMELQNRPLWEHSRRVALLTRKMAEVLEIPRKQRVQLEVASLFHDLGKLGTLTGGKDAETESEACPAIGSAIIGMLPEYEEAARAIRFHHERFDGSGYPEGLIGLQIPLLARMIAAADTCEKLLRKNQLKLKSPSAALICDQMDTLSGQLDPDMIAVLREVLNREQRKLEPAGTAPVLSDLYRNKTGELVENVQNLDLPHLRQLGIYPKSMPAPENPGTTSSRQPSRSHAAYRQAAGKTGGTVSASRSPQSIPHSTITGQSVGQYRQQTETPAPVFGSAKSTDTPAVVATAAPQETPVSLSSSTAVAPKASRNPEIIYQRYDLQRDREGISWSDVMRMAREHSWRDVDESSVPSGHVIDMTRYRKNGKMPDELRIHETDLCAGMILSRDLMTGRGIMLLHRDSVIREEYIPKLSALLENDPPRDGVYVYNIRHI